MVLTLFNSKVFRSGRSYLGQLTPLPSGEPVFVNCTQSECITSAIGPRSGGVPVKNLPAAVSTCLNRNGRSRACPERIGSWEEGHSESLCALFFPSHAPDT